MISMRTLTVLFLGAACSMPAAAQTGFYFGGTVGNASVNSDYTNINLNFDKDEFAWSAFAGVRTTELLAVEASYNDFGNFSESREFDLTRTDVDVDLTGYDIMGVLTLPLGPLQFFGKGGIVYWDAKAVAHIQPPVGSGFQVREDDDGVDLAFGGGLEFRLGPALSLRGELEWFDIDDTEEAWFASAGLSYRF